MRIAINAHLLSPLAGYRQAGVSGYIQQLLQHLWPAGQDVDWSVYAPPGVTRRMLAAPQRVTLRNSRLNTVRPIFRILWEQAFAPTLLATQPADVLFCPLNVVPLAVTCPTVVTIHDMAFLRHKLHRTSRRAYLNAMTKLSIRKAAHVITVSEFTRHEVIDLLGISPHSVTTVLNGLDPRFAPLSGPRVQEFRKDKNLPDRFVLFVGTLEPRKNLVTLIKAYAKVRHQLRMPLLVVGGKGWMFGEILSLVQSLDLQNDVHFVGFVSYDDLVLYYAAATAMVYPSLYEGFGFPPLEAMAVGTPVVTSTAESLVEIVGNSALTVPPLDISGWSDALIRVTSDEALRTELTQRGLHQVRQFSWDTAARKTLDILSSCAGRIGRRSTIASARQFDFLHKRPYPKGIEPPAAHIEEPAVTASQPGSSERFTPVGAKAARTRKSYAQPVLFFNHVSVLGGAELFLLRLLRHIDRKRVEPIVVLCDSGPLSRRLHEEGITTYILPLPASLLDLQRENLQDFRWLNIDDVLTILSFATRLSAMVRRHKIDLIHTNSLKAHVIGSLVSILTARRLIFHMHNRIEADYLPLPGVRLIRTLCRIFPDHVICNSKSTMQTLRLVNPLIGSIVYPGVELSEPRGHLNNPPSIPSMPLVGIIGRISRFKGHDVFIRAIASVHRRLPEVRFRIIGSAMFFESNFETEIRNLVSSLGLDECVEFLGFRDDVETQINQLDVVVHASVIGEPFGQVVAEAMRAGKAVVATNGGGIPELVTHGVTGLLVPLNDAPAMAIAICELLNHPAQAREMGERGQRYVTEHFGMEGTARRVEEVYTLMKNRVHPWVKVAKSLFGLIAQVVRVISGPSQ